MGVNAKIFMMQAATLLGQHVLDKPVIRIGARPGNDICCSAMGVRQAELVREEEEWIIRSADGQPFQFKGYPVLMKKLNPGDRVDLGDIVLIFETVGADTGTAQTLLDDEAARVGCLTLKVMEGRNAGKIYHLRKGLYTLGRPVEGSEWRIALDDPYISRDHAELSVGERDVGIVDLGSRNGTKLAGKRIRNAAATPPFVISVGETSMIVEWPVDPQDDRTQIIAGNTGSMVRGKTARMVFILLAAGCLLALLALLVARMWE
jgi:hypothetical protein